MNTIQEGNLLPPVPPDMAILSQTLNSSSTTKWIIPARIRNASRNDVVFISDTSIQLREFVTTSEAHLTDVTEQFNFRVPILAARVVSAKAVPVELPDLIDNPTVEDERYVLGNEPLPDDHPAQILVLSLASCELVFVYARECLDGMVTFQWARRPVLSGVDLPDKFGRHLAVDPESRALAFAPSMGYFAIASLRPIDELKMAIDRWRPESPKSFMPWTEQHFIRVDGWVVKMDFLQSADEDHSKVILMLLVANAGQTSLLLYRWDTGARLHHIKPMRCSGQVLRYEDSFPLMLIPCRGLASFFIVTETELVLYSQVTASKARRSAYPLLNPASIHPVQTSKHLLWTQWAKPRRHHQYNSTNDDVMLVREDGLLKLFVVEHKPEPRANISTQAGHLGFNVDSAFCMLPGHQSIGGGDILIAGGNLNDGGVFHLAARQGPRQMQSLPNAAPFNDLVLLPSRVNKPPYVNERHLYACCGSRDGSGGFVQIHHGVAAHIGWTMAHSDATSIERIWTIEAQHQNILLLLFSHSIHTSLILFNVRTTELEYASHETHPDLEFDNPTLAAAALGNDIFVQLTTHNINILSFSHRLPAIRREFKTFKPLCAVILEQIGLAAVAHPTLDGFAISLLDIRQENLDEDPFKLAAKLQNQPLTLHVSIFNQTPVLFVGTEQGHLTAFMVDESLKLVKIFQHNLSDIDESIQDSTISSLCLLARPSNAVGLLLCGLRSGWLVCIELKAGKRNTGSFQVQYQSVESFRLGFTAVSLSPDSYASEQGPLTSAFAVCRTSLKRISLKDNGAGADFSVTPVFVADREMLSGPLPIINVVNRVQRLSCDPSSDINGLLMCATAENLLFSSLVAQPGAVLQRTAIPGVPKCLLMSPFLKQMVIGVDTAAGPNVIFLTPDTNDSDKVTYAPSQSVVVGSTTEKIRSLMNYKPTNGKQHYEFLVIALNSDRTDPTSGALVTIGNVVCLSLKRILRGKADTSKAQSVIKLSGNGITAICVCGTTSMLIGTEKNVILHDFILETREWKKLSEYDLPSAVVSVDVKEARIFVATQKHGLMQFKESGGNLVLVEPDSQAKNAVQVLTYGGAGRKTLALMSMSDKGTTITGMAEDPMKGGLGRVWEGTVPLFIGKLVEETQGLGSTRERSAFIGATKDGTLYRFLTLKSEEFELLKWLEGLYRERKGGAEKRRLARRGNMHGLAGERHGKGREVSTHVDGDALTGLVDMGAVNLREVLEPRVKEEGEDMDERHVREDKMEELQNLAAPFVGEVEDVVGAVIIWLRRLLTWRVE